MAKTLGLPYTIMRYGIPYELKTRKSLVIVIYTMSIL